MTDPSMDTTLEIQFIPSSTLINLSLNGLRKYFGTIKPKLVYDNKRLQNWLNRRQHVKISDGGSQDILLAQNKLETKLDGKFTNLESSLEKLEGLESKFDLPKIQEAQNKLYEKFTQLESKFDKLIEIYSSNKS